MAITIGINAGGATQGASSSFTRSIGSVTAGQLIVVTCSKRYNAVDDPFTAGDCTQSAGTATIGAVTLDHQNGGIVNGSYIYVATWSCIVATTGTLTMQVASTGTDSQWALGGIAVNGSWDSSRIDGTPIGAEYVGFDTTGASGIVTSTGAAIFVGNMGLNNYGTCTPTKDGNFTAIFNNDGATHQAADHAYRIVSTGTASNNTVTLGAGLHQGGYITLVAYKEATGGQSSAPRAMLLGIG